MNPLKFRMAMDYLTRVKKVKPDLPDVFPASKAPMPPKKESLETMEAINRFVRDNPRQDMAGGGRIEFSGAGLAKQKVAAEKYGMSLEKYQNLSQQEKTKLKDRARRETAMAKGIPVDGVKVSKNIRKLPNGTFRFETEAGGGFNKIFPKETTLKQAEDFRDEKLREFGIEKGKNRPVNPDRGDYIGVKGEKHIKFNGVTYQVQVQRMKDGKMVSEKPYYTSDLDDAIKVRNQRVAKAPPKIEKGVINPDREKIQRKIDQRRFIQKVKEGRGVDFKSPKGYQVHHLLPFSLVGPDTSTRDLAVVNTQMNLEMAQFDKPIKNLTEEAALLDYNGDRKNSLKRLKEINKELNDIVKKGVKKLGPEYKGLIGFNELVPVYDANGVVVDTTYKPVGIDFQKSIAKNIEVPEKIKNISTKEIQKLVAEAPRTEAKQISQNLRKLGFKCKFAGSTGGLGSCDDPMSYVDDIKKQEDLLKVQTGKAPKAIQTLNTARKLNAAKSLFTQTLGPGALVFETVAALPVAYMGYKGGKTPANILADATYGLLGTTDQRILLDKAIELGYDTSNIKNVQDFYKKADELDYQEGRADEFMIPDDAFMYPRQVKKAEEDLLGVTKKFLDPLGNVIPEKEAGFEQLQKAQEAVFEDQAKLAAERQSKVGGFLQSPITDYVPGLAGGGIAKLAGIDSGPPPVSGPNSQGLQGLMKRVKRI